MKTSFLVITIYFSFTFVAVSQTWPKIYINPAGHSIGLAPHQTYDNGVIVLSQVLGEYGLRKSGWIIKSDINGNMLWDRQIGNPNLYLSLFDDLSLTTDSGCIVAMSTKFAELLPFGNLSDPAYLKLNACGQVEWCNIIHSFGVQNIGIDVVETLDGYVGLYENENANNNIVGLVKMDLEGNIQWMFTYDSDSIINVTCFDLLALEDGSVLVTGYGYYYMEPFSYWGLKPFKLHVDQEGEVIRWQAIHSDDDSLKGGDYRTIQSANGRLYSAGFTITTNIYPYNYSKKSLRKHTLDDTSQEFFVLSDTFSDNNSLAWMHDSNIVISGTTENPDVVLWPRADILITDTLGNVIHRRILLESYSGNLFRISTTENNKILATGSAEENPYGPMLNTMLFKLTSTLEDDVFDPTPRDYDYACPGGVAPHDTIGMEECDIVVSAEHLATLPDVAVIEVYPNPVKDHFQVRLPEFIALRNTNKGLSTALYQSNYQQQSVLQVFDLSGRFISEQKLTQSQLIAEFDASNWAPGMYLLRLVYKDKTVGSAKVVK